MLSSAAVRQIIWRLYSSPYMYLVSVPLKPYAYSQVLNRAQMLKHILLAFNQYIHELLLLYNGLFYQVVRGHDIDHRDFEMVECPY